MWRRRRPSFQVAREEGLAADRRGQIDFRNGITNLRQTVNPDFVVEIAKRRKHVLALPFRGQHRGIVEDIAQPEDQRDFAAFQHFQGFANFAAQAERLFVDDKKVWIEDVGGMADNRGPHRQRLCDIDLRTGRGVFAVAQLYHAGHADKVDTGVKFEISDDRGAG